MTKRVALAAVVAAFAGVGVVLTLWRSATAATARGGSPTFVAVLPDVGTVYARYECTRGRRFALGLHVFDRSQTTGVRFRAGGFRRIRTVQPGDPTSWFRLSGRRVQWLAAAAGGENGTVVGWVSVAGYPNRRRGCAPFAPPRVTVQIYPRRYYYTRGILRRLIG